MSDFHVWSQITGQTEECQQCGVIAPAFGSRGHRPLPRFCPGPREGLTHVFVGSPKEIVCVRCNLVVPRGTMPNEIDWSCNTPWQGA